MVIKLELDAERCRPCERCLAALACPKGALTQEEPGTLPTLRSESCGGCVFCSPACPYDAIVEMEE